jgi:hypothetical protein
MDEGLLITGKRLAELARCTKSAVSKATKQGRLPREGDGLYNPKDPRILAWLGARDRKAGVTIEGLKATLTAPEPEDLEDSWLQVDADFGDGFEPCVRYRFDNLDRELDSFFYAIPAPVRIVFEGTQQAPCHVELLDSGEWLPTRSTVGGKGVELEKRTRA